MKDEQVHARHQILDLIFCARVCREFAVAAVRFVPAADARGNRQKGAVGFPPATLSGYSVVLPSKCSSPASASALVARTTPSR